MSEQVVIVVEYEAGPDVHLGLHDALTQIREGVDRLDQVANIKVVQIHVAIKDTADQVLAVFAEDETSKAPSSPVETTAGSEQRPHNTGVIRPADEAEGDWCAHVTLARIYREERDAALEGIIRRDDALGIYDAEITRLRMAFDGMFNVRDAQGVTIDRLTKERDEARAEVKRLWAALSEVKITERDAVLERLTYDRNHPPEATDTPHNDPEFGFDKTAALSDPGETSCPNSCDGQSAVWSTPDKIWRCGTCGRIVGQTP